jgi:hypothetical protein
VLEESIGPAALAAELVVRADLTPAAPEADGQMPRALVVVTTALGRLIPATA